MSTELQATTDAETDDKQTGRPTMDGHMVCTRCGDRIDPLSEWCTCPECGAIYCDDCREDDSFCDECAEELP